MDGVVHIDYYFFISTLLTT